MSTIRIATRQSPLALWQAEYVKQQLEKHHPGIHVELVPLKTRGDKILDTPLAKIGGKGLFVKELEIAMLEHKADIAVHSMKDVPMEFPQGLCLQTICKREDPFDALVSNQFQSLKQLPYGAIVGTSSLRRQCQLRALRPDLNIRDLRGNVGTRLNKLDNGEFDAIILASAGLKRLGLTQRIAASIPPEQILPAGGQGAVGIECRSDDEQLHELLKPLNHAQTSDRVMAERAMNQRLQGGCQVPIGCFATIQDNDQLWLRGLVGAVNGTTIIQSEQTGLSKDAKQLGITLAEQLLEKGAGPLLEDVTRESH